MGKKDKGKRSKEDRESGDAEEAAAFLSSFNKTPQSSFPETEHKDDEESFVRGRPQSLDTKPQKRPTAAPEVLFGEGAQRKKRKTDKSKSQKRPKQGKHATEAGEDGGRERTQQARLLTFKQIKVGMALLAAVKTVNKLDLSVSLPHGLSGYVALREVSDTLASIVDAFVDKEDDGDDSELPVLGDMFAVGQLVRVVVTKVTNSQGRKRIDLSMRPSLVNKGVQEAQLTQGAPVYGAVKSKEEKGYVIELGTSVNGFLPLTLCEKQLSLGEPVCCVVTAAPRGRVAALTAKADDVRQARADRDRTTVPLAGLVPGVLVTASLAKVQKAGLLFNMMTFYTGTVDLLSLAEHAEAGWASKYDDLLARVSKDKATKKQIKMDRQFDARVLYVDRINKRVALTINPRLVALQPFTVPRELREGVVLEDAEVTRVESKTGIFLSGQVGEHRVLASAHVSRISKDKVDNVHKKFQVGNKVRCRVLTWSFLDGMASVTLKPDVLEQEVLWASDVQPGMLLKVTVVKQESYGLLVSITKNVRGLIPTMHLSDYSLGTAGTTGNKFKVGRVLTARVLQNDLEAQRISLTLKPTLVKSKHTSLTHFQDATPGMLAHGFVSGVGKYGIIVQFLGDVHGLVPLDDLRKTAFVGEEQSAGEVFHKGQVLQCCVMSVNALKAKLILTLDLKAKPFSTGTGGKGGNSALQALVGTVVQVRIKGVLGGDTLIAKLTGEHKGVQGTLHKTHLSDHPFTTGKLLAALVARLAKAKTSKKDVKAGNAKQDKVKLDVLVLAVAKGQLVLSAKPSLLQAPQDAQKGTEDLGEAAKDQRASLPRDLSQLSPGRLLQGYVHKVADYGVFVRFLGWLTGLAPRSQISDHFVTDPSELFAEGQSVRARVVEVKKDEDEFVLSLQPSLCHGSMQGDKAFALSLFSDMDRISLAAECAHVEAGEAAIKWEQLAVGSRVEATVQAAKSVGLVLQLAPGVQGFVMRPYHSADGGSKGQKKSKKTDGKDFKKGSVVKGLILDRDQRKRVCDVSLRPQLLSAKSSKDKGKKSKKDRKKQGKLRVGATVQVVMQLVRDDYCVVSLPQHDQQLAVAPTQTFNMRFSPHSVFRPGYACKATVVARPKGKVGRTIVLLNDKQLSHKPKRKFLDSSVSSLSCLKAGKTVRVCVGNVSRSDLAVHVSLGEGCEDLLGRIHISELPDGGAKGWKSLQKYESEKGKFLSATVLRTSRVAAVGGGNRAHSIVIDLSLREASEVGTEPEKSRAVLKLEALQAGSVYKGHVVRVAQADCAVWIRIGPAVLVQAAGLDVSAAPADLANLQALYPVATPVHCRVLHVDPETKKVFVMIVKETELTKDIKKKKKKSKRKRSEEGEQEDGVPRVDDVMSGRIAKLLPHGLGVMVQLRGGRLGNAHVTELKDGWPKKPLSSVKIGAIVRARVLAISGKMVHLTLRQSQVGDTSAAKRHKAGEQRGGVALSEVKVGQLVHGYVQRTNKGGCFVALGRDSRARVQLKNLADRYVQKPDEEFPAGMLVQGKVLSVDAENGLCELTLRDSSLKEESKFSFADLAKGGVVECTVKAVQSYGLFLDITDSALTGLCHISQLSDRRVEPEELAGHYNVGDRVKAVVLALDPEKKRISLGLKASLFEAEEDEGDEGESEAEAVAEEDATMNQPGADDDNDSDDEGDSDDEEELAVVAVGDDDSDNSDDESDEEETQGAGVLATFGGEMEALVVGADKEVVSESESEDSEEEEEEEEEQLDKKKSKRAKATAKREKERSLQEREADLAGGEHGPVSAADFERMLVSSPNSSYVWVKYMEFQIKLAELDKARAVAERGIKTIDFKEQQEKFNMWLALLNLEARYGSETTLERVVVRCCEQNEPKRVLLELARIQDGYDHPELAVEVYDTLIKRFPRSAQPVQQYAMFHFHRKQPEKARDVLTSALERLEQRQHVDVIAKFAHMEFKLGSAERGRTLLEGILQNYPKRADLWSQYLDMEIRLCKQQESPDYHTVRTLFKRVTTLSLSSKKMRFFFKRYLVFEQETTKDEEAAATVMQSARAYVAAKHKAQA